MAIALKDLLDARTRAGELYEKLEDNKIRCYACAHHCVIFDGKRGICQVRFNRDGQLYVPWGYVGSLGLDPIEKKPFYHVLPGARTLTFGMLGCDLHCPYCTVGRTPILTAQGPATVVDLFHRAIPLTQRGKSTIAVLPNVAVYTHAGRLQHIRRIFRHHYSGPMLRIKPRYLLPIDVTPEHEFLVIEREVLQAGCAQPHFVRAAQLTKDHYLVIPKRFGFSQKVVYRIPEVLKPSAQALRYPHKLGPDFLKLVLHLTEEGLSSREIGRRLGKSASHIRHLRSRVYRGLWNLVALDYKPAQVIVEDGRARFSKEHVPGIPAQIPLTEELAELLGYYIAEGSVLRHKQRVHSADLVFALGPHEEALAKRIQRLVRMVFGVEAYLTRRQTTLCVIVSKTSVALFFEQLCGTGSRKKRIPPELSCAPQSIVERFLQAYVKGDGHRDSRGKISIGTVSEALALGVAWLLLKTGRFPALYRKRQTKRGTILGRQVNQAPYWFSVVWYETPSKRRWLLSDDQHYYVPIEEIERYRYNGYVYNLEVEGDHSYLAQFVATHNCQNWSISQTLRDKNAGALPHDVTPEELVALAQRYGARAVISSYNEPLITSEWAVSVFKEAKRLGLLTGYVSNGNATREVLQYLRPHLDCYKIDLKTFQDKNYRVLGAVLSKILDGIAMVHELGFWLEIVTLVIPGFNDSDDELRQIARFLVSISPDIPWHVTAFHKDYKMTDPDNTPAETLIRAAQIGYDAGLHFVYTGNLPGMTGRYENTYCPGCGALLIERYGFAILQNRLRDGHCPDCGRAIPGVWTLKIS